MSRHAALWHAGVQGVHSKGPRSGLGQATAADCETRRIAVVGAMATPLADAVAWVLRSWEATVAQLQGSLYDYPRLPQAGRAGVLCAGWEIVCPDGRVRHYPFHNMDDAEDAADHCATRCNPYKVPSALFNSLPPCPHGAHAVRPVLMQDKVASRGQA
jgi:hypothetical protein